MALPQSRQLIVWSIPSIAIFLTYLWYRKKKSLGRQSRPRSNTPKEKQPTTTTDLIQESSATNLSDMPAKQKHSKARCGANNNHTDTASKNPDTITAMINDYEKTAIKPSLKACNRTADVDVDSSSLPITNAKQSQETQITCDRVKSLRIAVEGDAPYAVDDVDSVKCNGNSEHTKKKPTLCHLPVANGSHSASVTTENLKNCDGEVQSNIQPEHGKRVDAVPQSGECQPSSSIANEHQVSPPAVDSSTDAPITTNGTPNETAEHEISIENGENVCELNERRRASDINQSKTERDSANQSPVDVMLTSPSLSCISDNNSEGSSDSGKGRSEVITTPPPPVPLKATTPVNTMSSTVVRADTTAVVVGPTADNNCGASVTAQQQQRTTYEFLLPQSLVGKLIGVKGRFLHNVRMKTNVRIYVQKQWTHSRVVVRIEGHPQELNDALKMIRVRFPLAQYSHVTLEQINHATCVESCTVPIVNIHQLYLRLVEGINNDTIVSCMVAPNHLFVQQPTHPSFLSLANLTSCINYNYTETESPLMATPIPDNTICVAFSVGSWYRAMVLTSDDENASSFVKFLDYGGYAYVENSKLRQIHRDFMFLPFQSAECFLANIQPKGGKDANWCDEAFVYVANTTKGSLLYTQVMSYTEENIPLVNCYVVAGDQLIFINDQLVTKGYATRVNDEASSTSTTTTYNGAAPQTTA